MIRATYSPQFKYLGTVVQLSQKMRA